MELQVLSGITLDDIVQNPDNFPDEIIAASISVLKTIAGDLAEKRKLIEGRLIDRMQKDGASKLPFIAADGAEHMLTLKKGKMEVAVDDADQIITEAGFNALEFGKYEYVPSWTKSKEKAKLGGAAKDIVDKIFSEGKQSISIN
jgi:hypothetical protein